MQFRKIPDPSLAVLAVEITSTLSEALGRLDAISDGDLTLDITGDLSYNKWGGPQTASVGGFLLNNGGEAYTCERTVFETTYEGTGNDNEFVKTAPIEAVEATEDGKIVTIEGESAYQAGDFIVTNPGGDQYCIKREKFLSMYEAV